MAEELLVTRVSSRSIGVAGRSVSNARHNHFVVDEPAYGGGPGEAVTPAEAFLAGVSACGVLLVESFARQDGVALAGVEASIEGVRTKADPSQFQKVTLRFTLRGVDRARAEALVERFKGR
jgi:uncharacterized OsmC-like protein